MTASMFAFRPGEARARGDKDRAFVIDSWLESWFLAHMAGTLPKDLHNDAYARAVERILARPDTRVLVALNPEADDATVELAGMLVAGAPAHRHGSHGEIRCGKPTLYYLFVKLHYRNKGAARGMLDAAGFGPGASFCYPFSTQDWHSIAKKHYPPSRCRWDPLIARFCLPPP